MPLIFFDKVDPEKVGHPTKKGIAVIWTWGPFVNFFLRQKGFKVLDLLFMIGIDLPALSIIQLEKSGRIR